MKNHYLSIFLHPLALFRPLLHILSFSILVLFLFIHPLYASKTANTQSLDTTYKPVISPNIDLDHYREFYTGQDAINWWSRLYAGLKFPEDEREAIFNYTFGYYFAINDKLRNAKGIESLNEKEKQMLTTLDRALSKTIIFENFIVYRYENLSFLTRLINKDFFFRHIYINGKFQKGAAERYLNTLIDKKYKDYGFMSTTMMRNSVFQTRPIELVIKVPKLVDATFVSMPGLAVFQTQYELLFPRNRILTIETYKISDDRKKITIYTKMRGVCYFPDPCLEPRVDNLNQPNMQLLQ